MPDALRPLEEYRAFVFDFDGVLADSVEIKAEAFGALYLAHGEDVARRVMEHHRAHGGMTRREKFLVWHREFLGQDLDPAGLDQLCRQFSALVVDRVVAAPEIPGVLAFLGHWRGRMSLFVDSAGPDDELREIVRRRGLDGYFVSTHGSNRTKADNLRHILDANGLAPERVLFFGDASSDLAAARACGTDFLGILPGPDAPLLSQAQGIPWVSNFNALPAHKEGTP